MPPPSSRRRWFTLSLRSLLGLVLVVGLALGGWIKNAQTQAEAVAALQAIAVDAHFEYGVKTWGPFRGFRMVYDETSPTDEDKLPWWVPLRLYHLLGRDYFLTANMVSIALPTDPVAHSAAIGQMARLRHLSFLEIDSSLDDADIERLAHLDRL